MFVFHPFPRIEASPLQRVVDFLNSKKPLRYQLPTETSVRGRILLQNGGKDKSIIIERRQKPKGKWVVVLGSELQLVSLTPRIDSLFPGSRRYYPNSPLTMRIGWTWRIVMFPNDPTGEVFAVLVPEDWDFRLVMKQYGFQTPEVLLGKAV